MSNQQCPECKSENVIPVHWNRFEKLPFFTYISFNVLTLVQLN